MKVFYIETSNFMYYFSWIFLELFVPIDSLVKLSKLRTLCLLSVIFKPRREGGDGLDQS